MRKVYRYQNISVLEFIDTKYPPTDYAIEGHCINCMNKRNYCV
jgi:hypothetical protein